MPIVGFNFEKMLAEKKKSTTGKKLNIKTSMGIEDIKKEEIPMAGKKKEQALKFMFKFHVMYEPQLADIILQGHILYIDAPKSLEGIQKGWKKNKKIPDELMTSLLNVALYRCNIKALILSQEVGLPPNLRLPTVKPKTDASNYIG